jgi:hypothetical protein
LVEECWGWHAGVELDATIMDLYVFYGFLVGGGIGAFTVSLTATVTRWFVTHRGLAVSITNGGIGAGGMMFAPWTRHLVIVSGGQRFSSIGFWCGQ